MIALRDIAAVCHNMDELQPHDKGLFTQVKNRTLPDNLGQTLFPSNHTRDFVRAIVNEVDVLRELVAVIATISFETIATEQTASLVTGLAKDLAQAKLSAMDLTVAEVRTESHLELNRTRSEPEGLLRHSRLSKTQLGAFVSETRERVFSKSDHDSMSDSLQKGFAQILSKIPASSSSAPKANPGKGGWKNSNSNNNNVQGNKSDSAPKPASTPYNNSLKDKAKVSNTNNNPSSGGQ